MILNVFKSILCFVMNWGAGLKPILPRLHLKASEVASLQQTSLIVMQVCAVTSFRQLSAVDKLPGFSSL